MSDPAARAASPERDQRHEGLDSLAGARRLLAGDGKPTLAAWLCAALALFGLVILGAALTAGPGEFLKGVAELLKAVTWPLAIVVLLLTFRDAIAAQFGRLRTFEMAGAKVEFEAAVESRLRESANEAEAKPTAEAQSVSLNEIERAQDLDRLATATDLSTIRRRMLDLANEYRFVRGSMAYGNERTRALTVIVSQMRTLGRAAFPLRGEFAFSADAGQRLAALAIAQVQPDLTMLDWIAARVSRTEKPFVQYHALQALLIAARNADASHTDAMRRAYKTASENYAELAPPQRTDRLDLLEAIKSELAYL